MVVPFTKTDEHLVRLANKSGMYHGLGKDVEKSPWPMLTSLNNHVNLREGKDKNHDWLASPNKTRWKASPPHGRKMGERDQPDGCEEYGFGQQHSGIYAAMEEAKMLNGYSNGTAYPVTSRIVLKSSPNGSPGLQKPSPKVCMMDLARQRANCHLER